MNSVLASALLNQVVQGILLGGLYALFAVGLSLSVGIMRFVNIAHGDVIVLFSFVLYALATVLGVPPFVGLVLLLPVGFACGYALQRVLLHRVIGKSVLPVILVTFGLSIIMQNGLLEAYGPDTRKLSAGSLETASIDLGVIVIGVQPLLTFIAAVVLVGALERLLYHTGIGARIRAVSDSPASADLIGLPSASIYAIAMGIVGATAVVAAGFMSVWTNFDPSIGPSRLLAAFEVVVLGGLGSLWGTLLGGMLLGVAQSLGAQVDAAWQVLAGHLLFLVVLVLRPQGLLPKN